MKCDTCKYMITHKLGKDECGGRNFDQFCQKKHWKGIGNSNQIDTGNSVWDLCKDFEIVDDVWLLKNIDEISKEYLDKLHTEGGWKYQIHYVDYGDNEWTSPVYLSENRIAYIVNDYSIDKIKLISGT